MEHPVRETFLERNYQRIVVAAAALIFAGCALSPPSLMDDVDAVQAQISRNMLESGDWVTARLNGIAYLEKAPLKYWMIAASFAVFGVHDWAARLPLVAATIALCWLTAIIGAWAFSKLAGLYAGLSLCCIGLFLFTRILIPDAVLTLTITLALWSFLRALEGDGPKWAWTAWASMGAGFLLKGLIAMLFPVGAAFLYLAITKQLFSWKVLARLKPFSGLALLLAISAPWVILATLRNPPYFDFTMRSVAGEYHGFFWFFFLNEHLFRFLNMRHPRDYNTFPRHLFWLFHLLWLFPWSLYLPAAFREGFGDKATRAGRMRLLAFCWAGFLMLFFTFSTTQEYYSMPCYPALALLIGAAMARNGPWIRPATTLVGAVAALASLAAFAILLLTIRTRATGSDISEALTSNPEAYTLSLGHMNDLTLSAFAYLRAPLALAAIAFACGAFFCLRSRWKQHSALGLALMMVLFTHAARMALVVFDPYLSSRPLAEALRTSPPGDVIFDNQYYTFSSVFFYANPKTAWLLDGRVNNLEYGSYAPQAPQVFIDADQFEQKWKSGKRHYLLVEGPSTPRLEWRVGGTAMHIVKASGGKFLFTNLPLK